jgi:hypothetical protein
LKKIALVTLSILMLVTLAISGCTGNTTGETVTVTVTGNGQTAEPEVFHWKGQYAYAIPADPGYFETSWLPGNGCSGVSTEEWIETISDGRIQIDMSPPGSIVPVADMFKAVSDGTIDISGGLYGGYYTAQVPETDIEIGLPYAWPNAQLAFDWYYQRGGYEMFNEEVYSKHGVWFIPVPGGTTYSFSSFNFDISEGLSSIKGKKLRALGIYGDLAAALGASPTVIPGPDMYMAAKTGTIDGAIYGFDGIDSVKLVRIPGCPVPWQFPEQGRSSRCRGCRAAGGYHRAVLIPPE